MSYCKITKRWLPAKDMVIAYDEYEEQVLVSPEAVVAECEDCGKKYTSTENIHGIAYDTYVCEDCYDNNYSTCDYCGHVFRTDDGYVAEGDEHICQECRDDHYTACYHCGVLVRDGNIQRTEDDYCLCDNCYENNTTSCYECGYAFYNEENMCWDNEEEAYFCRDCYNSNQKVIKGYSYKPAPIFKKTLKDAVKAEQTKEYFGFEIEVAGNTDYADSFLEEFGDTKEDILYLKSDSSVDGFEIVTHPMTRDYFIGEFVPRLTMGFNYLKGVGFRGHNAGGIHIHVSTEAISQDQIKKLTMLLYPNNREIKKKWLKITQRKEYSLDRWSSMTCDKEDKKKIMQEADVRKEANDTSKYCWTSRYTAMNLNNYLTVEFRMFNSNLRTERVIKNAEVIFSLLDFTKTDAMPTFGNYMRFVKEHREDYSYLYDFLIEKAIIRTDEKQKQVKEILKIAKQMDASVEAMSDLGEYIRSLNIVPPLVPEEEAQEYREA